jgi:hypothetical protein
MFAPCINSIKELFIIPTDAHNYKITGILKQLKFRLSLRHVSVHARTIIREPFLCLAKTTVWFYILVDYDVVNVMAAYQPVVRVCGIGDFIIVCISWNNKKCFGVYPSTANYTQNSHYALCLNFFKSHMETYLNNVYLHILCNTYQ